MCHILAKFHFIDGGNFVQMKILGWHFGVIKKFTGQSPENEICYKVDSFASFSLTLLYKIHENDKVCLKMLCSPTHAQFTILLDFCDVGPKFFNLDLIMLI